MPETTQQLKADINTGATGDKINQDFDPGLSTLGTDDEAAGTPNTPAQVAAARRLETASPAIPAEQGSNNPRRSYPAMWVIVAALVVVLVAIGFALV